MTYFPSSFLNTLGAQIPLFFGSTQGPTSDATPGTQLERDITSLSGIRSRAPRWEASFQFGRDGSTGRCMWSLGGRVGFHVSLGPWYKQMFMSPSAVDALVQRRTVRRQALEISGCSRRCQVEVLGEDHTVDPRQPVVGRMLGPVLLVQLVADLASAADEIGQV